MPGHEGTAGYETDQLARMGSEHLFIGPEPAYGISGVAKNAMRNWKKSNHLKILGIINWNYTRTLCHKNKGSVKIKQKSGTMGGGTIYRTLFQIGTAR
jgi:hypothetical protein